MHNDKAAPVGVQDYVGLEMTVTTVSLGKAA